MKKLILILGLCLVSAPVWALDPSSLKVKVFGVYASTSELCTNPTQIFLNNTGEYVDFLKGPTLGGGDLPDGTYNCVIIKMSDVIKHTPTSTSGSCTSGTEYTGEVCTSQDGATDLSGTAITCQGDHSGTAVEDTVFMYLTTNANAGTGTNAFRIPTDAASTYGIKLTAPLVISSTGSAKFVVDGTGKVDGSSSECGMNAPTFKFIKL